VLLRQLDSKTQANGRELHRSSRTRLASVSRLEQAKTGLLFLEAVFGVRISGSAWRVARSAQRGESFDTSHGEKRPLTNFAGLKAAVASWSAPFSPASEGRTLPEVSSHAAEGAGVKGRQGCQGDGRWQGQEEGARGDHTGEF
jgi:hypothetical protein